jgi:ubiquinone/menaquinone biosynthesis C-methylase UbiE
MSLGCGDPTALADLQPGETVLDLGSGGGLDVLLAANKVGPTGKTYGLDMTEEMIHLAREYQQKVGLSNAEFILGDIEEIPLPDCCVDVILSNCAINLSAEKARVFSEAFRVLRPGGRLAISDIVNRGSLSAQIRLNLQLWADCIAGALDEHQYVTMLVEAGFHRVSVQPTWVFHAEYAREFLSGAGLDVDQIVAEADGKFMSAFIRAEKPEL